MDKVYVLRAQHNGRNLLKTEDMQTLDCGEGLPELETLRKASMWSDYESATQALGTFVDESGLSWRVSSFPSEWLKTGPVQER